MLTIKAATNYLRIVFDVGPHARRQSNMKRIFVNLPTTVVDILGEKKY